SGGGRELAGTTTVREGTQGGKDPHCLGKCVVRACLHSRQIIDRERCRRTPVPARHYSDGKPPPRAAYSSSTFSRGMTPQRAAHASYAADSSATTPGCSAARSWSSVRSRTMS